MMQIETGWGALLPPTLSTTRRISPFWSSTKHGGNPPDWTGLPQCVLPRITPPWPQGRGRPWSQAAGAFPYSGLLRAPATLDQMKTDRRNLAGRLSGRDRAARCPTRPLLPRRDALWLHLSAQGLHKIAKQFGVGTGTVQRIAGQCG
jgi:hypothetical protein